MTGFKDLPAPRLKDPFMKKLWEGFTNHLAPWLDEFISPKSIAANQSENPMMAMLPALIPSIMPEIPSMFEMMEKSPEFRSKVIAFVAEAAEAIDTEEVEIDDPNA